MSNLYQLTYIILLAILAAVVNIIAKLRTCVVLKHDYGEISYFYMQIAPFAYIIAVFFLVAQLTKLHIENRINKQISNGRMCTCVAAECMYLMLHACMYT